METVARNRIKDFHFETNKTSLYHLHSIKEIIFDERKTLTKISMRNLSPQFPQMSAHIGHDKIRNKQTGEKRIMHNWWRIRGKTLTKISTHNLS